MEPVPVDRQSDVRLVEGDAADQAGNKTRIGDLLPLQICSDILGFLEGNREPIREGECGCYPVPTD
jgi:hypothetical protein